MQSLTCLSVKAGLGHFSFMSVLNDPSCCESGVQGMSFRYQNPSFTSRFSALSKLSENHAKEMACVKNGFVFPVSLLKLFDHLALTGEHPRSDVEA